MKLKACSSTFGRRISYAVLHSVFVNKYRVGGYHFFLDSYVVQTYLKFLTCIGGYMFEMIILILLIALKIIYVCTKLSIQ